MRYRLPLLRQSGFLFAMPDGRQARTSGSFRVEGAIMFKHILLPTDGSPVSDHTIHEAVSLAKRLGAKITGVHVMPEFHTFTYDTEMVANTRDQYAKDFADHAQQYLDRIAREAAEAEVPCETALLTSDHPHEAIIAAAQEKGCDLITMATHGRKGFKGLLLGSETQKVLTHSKVPVLVYH